MAYVWAAWIYRRKGHKAVSKYIERLAADFQPLDIQDRWVAFRLARRELVCWRILGRFMNEELVCLPASVSLTAALLALGLQAQVILGKPGHNFHETYEFHAWTAVDDLIINDEQFCKVVFVPILKYPIWPQR